MMKTGGKLNKRPASNKRTPGISAHYQRKKKLISAQDG